MDVLGPKNHNLKNNEKPTSENWTTYHIATRKSESRGRISAGLHQSAGGITTELPSSGSQQQQQWLNSYLEP
jgi:hypothetical protein